MNQPRPRFGALAMAACLASLLVSAGCTQEVIPAEDFVEDVTGYLVEKGLIEPDGGRVSTGDSSSSGGAEAGSSVVDDGGRSGADVAVGDVSQPSPTDTGAGTTSDAGSAAGGCKTAADCPKAGPPCLAADCDQGACGWKTAGDGTSCETACMTGGGCIQGQCVGGKVTSGDACDDGDGCTSKDECNASGMCIGKLQKCDDDNSCTHDICTSLGANSSQCAHDAQQMNGKVCQELNSSAPSQCDIGICQAGTCIGVKVQKTCDDNNPCTDDLCLIYESDYCTYPPTLKSKVPCNKVDGKDVSVCEIATCAAGTGKCKVTGTYLVSDGIKCSSKTDCGSGANYKDGLCDGGVCSACNDDNECTADACENSTNTCVHTKVKPGTSCKWGNQTGQCNHKGVCVD